MTRETDARITQLTRTRGADLWAEGGDASTPWLTAAGLAHAGAEFEHAAHAGHAARAAEAVGAGPGATHVLAPVALLSGIAHMLHAAHAKEGADKVANMVAGGAEAISGGIGTIGLAGHALGAVGVEGAGSALTGLAGAGAIPIIGQLAGALAAGFTIGNLLNETFDLPEKLSGPTPAERAGFIRPSERGEAGIKEANQKWIAAEVARLHDERGERGVAAQMLAIEKKKDSLVDEPQLVSSARAIYAMQELARKQQDMADRFQVAQRMAHSGGGMLGQLGTVMLHDAVAHYAD